MKIQKQRVTTQVENKKAGTTRAIKNCFSLHRLSFNVRTWSLLLIPAMILTSFSLFESSARAAIDCDLSPNAPICGGDPPPPPTPVPSTPLYPDRTLIKGSGPAIYVMEAGKRRHIPDPFTLNAMGFSWNAIKLIPNAELSAIPLGTPFLSLQPKVHVRIELLEVTCRNSEEVAVWPVNDGKDEFYVMGSLLDGTTTKGIVVPPIKIKNQTKPYGHVLFEADVPAGQTIRGGLKALEEDFSKDWEKYGSVINKIADGVAGELRKNQDTKDTSAADILLWAVRAFGFFASLDKDDELGTLEMNVPASGLTVEEGGWDIKGQWGPIKFYSDWDYTVRYRITRTAIN